MMIPQTTLLSLAVLGWTALAPALPGRALDPGFRGVQRGGGPCTLIPSRQAVAEATLGDRGEFGAAVAIGEATGMRDGPSGRTLAAARLCAVGSPRAMEAGSPRGSVRLFSLGALGPSTGACAGAPRATLRPRDLSAHARFGAALAVFGTDILAVGAPGANGTAGMRAGLVRLFSVGAVGYPGPLPVALVAELQPPVSSDGAGFGSSLAFRADGQQLAVGAPMARSASGAAFAGRVHVFDRTNGEWSHRFSVESPQPSVGATFGRSLAFVGETLIVGAPGDGAIAPAAGRVFGFHGDGPDVGQLAWDLGAPVGSTGASGMRYGEALAAVDATVFAVGGWGRGIVEVFRLPRIGGPAHQALLRGDPTEGFGLRVSGAAGELFVGSPFATGDLGEASAGRVDVFEESPAGWRRTGSLQSTHPNAGAEFGVAIAAAAGPGGDARVIVGEPGSHAACRGGSRCAAGAALVD